ncbi:hypothetical protein J6590_016464 [Homalodisca vitripennis]|nr:hypothetical protein J6590_016464 [Homalodisca vitripennis]
MTVWRTLKHNDRHLFLWDSRQRPRPQTEPPISSFLTSRSTTICHGGLTLIYYEEYWTRQSDKCPEKVLCEVSGLQAVKGQVVDICAGMSERDMPLLVHVWKLLSRKERERFTKGIGKRKSCNCPMCILEIALTSDRKCANPKNVIPRSSVQAFIYSVAKHELPKYDYLVESDAPPTTAVASARTVHRRVNSSVNSTEKELKRKYRWRSGRAEILGARSVHVDWSQPRRTTWGDRHLLAVANTQCTSTSGTALSAEVCLRVLVVLDPPQPPPPSLQIGNTQLPSTAEPFLLLSGLEVRKIGVCNVPDLIKQNKERQLEAQRTDKKCNSYRQDKNPVLSLTQIQIPML